MTQQDPQPSGWAIGGITFAAAIMILIGIFQVIAGIAAIAKDEFFVVGSNYAFNLDTTGWGWIHLIIGVIVLWAGIGLVQGKTWAGIVALTLAILTAVANFFYIPYYPWWSLLVIALCVWVIWSLTRPEVVDRR